MGSNGFGRFSVKGRSRVPSPAPRINAVRIIDCFNSVTQFRTYDAINADPGFRRFYGKIAMNLRWNPDHKFSAILPTSNGLRDNLIIGFHIRNHVRHQFSYSF